MNTYLVALDNSPRAVHVLAVSVSLASAAGARLVLFRAVGLPSDLPVEAYVMSPNDVINVLRERARQELDEHARTIPPSMSFETRVDVGAGWQAICQAGRDTSASMIIIGSHGYGGLDHLLGTTASKVVNHADRSVLVVRQPELLARADAGGSGPIHERSAS
jgi:universal stress protein F